MSKNGMLIDYEYCTGCLTCEVACQQEHDYPPGRSGIKVTEHVLQTRKKPVFIVYQPFLTEWCVLCARRTKAGELPSCVKHCPASCLSYGPLGELVREMEKRPKTALISPL
jgi:anaerobic dimethyl sulfoxide reductase subunit B (iron-sulfur subunit)